MNAETWFSTKERIARLQLRAADWIGTPFRANSCVMGPKGGVSCQKLAAALYRESGWVSVEVPEVAMAHARFARERSIVEEWLGRCEAMARLDGVRGVLPGDLLGFRLGRVVHHVGVAVTGQTFVHAMEQLKTSFGDLQDATWLSRLAVVWRPRP